MSCDGFDGCLCATGVGKLPSEQFVLGLQNLIGGAKLVDFFLRLFEFLAKLADDFIQVGVGVVCVNQTMGLLFDFYAVIDCLDGSFSVMPDLGLVAGHLRCLVEFFHG